MLTVQRICALFRGAQRLQYLAELIYNLVRALSMINAWQFSKHNTNIHLQIIYISKRVPYKNKENSKQKAASI